MLKLWFFAWNMKIGQPCPQPPNGWSVILWLHQTENRKYNYLFIFLFFWVSAAYMFILTAVGRKYFPTWYLTFYHLCWAQVVQHSSLSDSKDNWIILKDLSFLVCFLVHTGLCVISLIRVLKQTRKLWHVSRVSTSQQTKCGTKIQDSNAERH